MSSSSDFHGIEQRAGRLALCPYTPPLPHGESANAGGHDEQDADRNAEEASALQPGARLLLAVFLERGTKDPGALRHVLGGLVSEVPVDDLAGRDDGGPGNR